MIVDHEGCDSRTEAKTPDLAAGSDVAALAGIPLDLFWALVDPDGPRDV